MSSVAADGLRARKAEYGVSEEALAAQAKRKVRSAEDVRKARAKLDQALAGSIFTHCSGREMPASAKEHYWTKLKPVQKSLRDARNVSVNRKFAAYPWRIGAGSAIAILPLEKPGAYHNPHVIKGHKEQVSVLELNTLNPNLLLTGAHDGHLKVYEIPDGGLTGHVNDPMVDYNIGEKVDATAWHPLVTNVFAAGSHGFGEESHLSLFDIEKAEAQLNIDLSSWIFDISWDFNGERVGVTSRDQNARIVDPRAGDIAQEWGIPKEGVRSSRLFWIDSDTVITSGFGKRSTRNFSVWDLRNTSKPSYTQVLETSNSPLLPYYDNDSRLFFLAAYGERIIRIFDIGSESCKEFMKYQSDQPILGLDWQHKEEVNVREVEIAKGFNLQKDAGRFLTMAIPRKRKEYFQDDIYQPTRARTEMMSAERWFEGETGSPSWTDLKPDDMTNLSEAPAEAESSFSKRRKEILAEQEYLRSKEHALSEEEAIAQWTKKAEGTENHNQWDAQNIDDGAVSDGEWGDESD